MKKILIILLFISLSSISMAQMTHYSKYNKIEMEIFRNGELIGYNHYFFTKKGDEMIIDFLLPAFREYLSLYLNFLMNAEKVSPKRSLAILEGQKSYMKYRSQKDPARGMLTRFYGKTWTEEYIKKVLFIL